MNSGKQSYYEIQLSNGSLIVAFLVAVGIGVAVFVLGVMVGRGQQPQVLPETGWVEPLAANDAGASGAATTGDDLQEGVGGEEEAGFQAAGEDAMGDATTADPEPGLATPPPAAPPSAGLPSSDPALSSGWVIQVRSTDDQEDARALQEDLSRSGYPAFVVTADVEGVEYFRVRVGRYAAQSDAETVAAALSTRGDIEQTWVTQG